VIHITRDRWFTQLEHLMTSLCGIPFDLRLPREVLTQSLPELCAKILVRSHRLSPGKLTYATLPSDIFFGLDKDRIPDLYSKAISLGDSWSPANDAVGWEAEDLLAETFGNL
jgi:hypothetical protein